MRLFLVTILLVIVNNVNGHCQNLLNGPESVEYDLENNRYFISNYYDGAIIEMDGDGNQSVFYAGLPHSRGITIYDNILFVVHDSGMSGIDLATEDTVYNFIAPELVFPNDIAFDSSGNFYISDYVSAEDGGGIYKVNYSTGSYFKHTDDMDNINGITYDYENNRLLACGGYPTYRVFEIDPVSGTINNEVNTPFYSHDGIVLDLAGNVYVSSWYSESVYRYNNDFSDAPVVVASGLSGPADIYYNKWKHELIIPNLNNNTLDTVVVKTDQFLSINNGSTITPGASSWCVNWVDYDQDGYQDLFITNIDSENELYHNEGNGSFSQIFDVPLLTTTSGVMEGGSSWGDINNDGYPDLFIPGFMENNPPINKVFLNNGNGSFTQIIDDALVTTNSGSICGTWGDYNSDGLLDIYVSTHEMANMLFRQDDTGFALVNDSPIATDSAESNGAAWSDYDNDGDLDIISTSGWFSRNLFYQNNGDGSFDSVTDAPIATDAHTSWSASWGDYDNDMDMDLFITSSDWYSPSSSFDYLYKNNGDGSFARVIGIDPVSTSAGTWGSTWGDFDNDGDLDLVVAVTGSNLYHENLGDGTFDLNEESILYLDTDNTDGIACADYDGDGDLDIYACNYGVNKFYENTGSLNSWIDIKCEGTNSNRSGIGSKVFVKAEINGTPQWQKREITSRSGKNGQGSLSAHFGLGDATLIDSLKIEWPNGVVDVYANVAPNQFITYTESICGDVDANLNVNILDITFLISYLYKGGIAPGNLTTADPDGNGLVNILDITYLISYLYKGGLIPTC